MRRNRAAAASRQHRDLQASGATPEELATEERINAGRPWPEGPVAMLPVAQLYVRDIPLLRPPGQTGADLLQVLWCPFDHPAHPRTALYWRSAATVTDVLDAPPEPPAVQFPGYLPEPCLFAPEQVTEYPSLLELSKELQQQLGDWSRWQAAGSAVDSSYAPAPEELYLDQLSVAPGWKVGGWTRWGLTDPMPRLCPECGTGMDPLLTIASTEWNDGTDSWAPEEDQANPTPLLPGTPPANFTMLDLARGYDLQLYVCPKSSDHPHTDLIQ
ncbi:non-ribosomal peptide synthetase [Streptomyces sp. NPDC058992]|uniref:non-ribosomal peptide synthetase n=1 Tax=Streptomyces sp. NPDC058992 TaxID=3346688 RepID=UPI0036989C65